MPDIRMEEGGAEDNRISPRPTGKIDAPFTALLLLLLATGLVCLFSASYAVGYHDHGGNSMYFVMRQAFFAAFEEYYGKA